MIWVVLCSVTMFIGALLLFVSCMNWYSGHLRGERLQWLTGHKILAAIGTALLIVSSFLIFPAIAAMSG